MKKYLLPGIDSYGSSVTVNVADLVTPRVPEMVAVPGSKVLIVNVALVCPDGTNTLDGAVATDLLLLDKETEVPLDGAEPVRTTVPVEGEPTVTEVGFKVSEASCGASTVRVALRVTPL